jgi:uncharacterized protein (TIGR00369 family)
MVDVSTLHRQVSGLFPELIGVRFLEAAPERVVAELAVRAELCTTPGILHGGAIMAFADTLGGTATAMNLPPGVGTTTIESKTNFFAPGRTGDIVRGECIALHRGKRTLVWQTRVSGADGRLMAVVTQTQIVLEASRTPAETLSSFFAGKSSAEQKDLLAELERGGAAVYRALAAQEPDAATKRDLLAAAEREEENARLLEGDADT